jgi:DNA-binding beta-propeller fold protein YncE
MKTVLNYFGVRLSAPLVLALAACGQESTEPVADTPQAAAPTPAPQAAVANDCAPDSGISYVCGIINGEDILRLGDSQWLLISGMSGELAGDPTVNGKIHLVNAADRSFSVIFPGAAPVLEQNMENFSSCPGPLDTGNFSAHGFALRTLDNPGQYVLYMTSHGAREAIEVFGIDVSAAPAIKWIGCVPMPVSSWTNSIALLDDGGFVATQFMDQTGSGIAGVLAQEITGHLWEWHPGGEVTKIEGTDLSGANGIVLSDDERYAYVAAFGTAEVVRFDRTTTPAAKQSIAMGVRPDNVRWSSDGTLYTAGGNLADGCTGPDCGAGWSVWEIDPQQLTAVRLTGADPGAALQGVSSALLVDDEIWVGTYGGDRVAILPKP